MKTILTISLFLIGSMFHNVFGQFQLHNQSINKNSLDLKIQKIGAYHDEQLDILVLEIETKGLAGRTVPSKYGALDGAPVLGYVFPTTLSSIDVGFGETEGIVALALASHPDFDDTPLWDENADTIFDNDGVIWHPHWVLLVKNDRVAGGLSVKQFDPEKDKVTLPPTNPGMPMYMDSPGFPVKTQAGFIRVTVPAYRINHKTDFTFDGVTAYMQVNASDPSKPLLGVYEVYDVASGDLSLPFKVGNR